MSLIVAVNPSDRVVARSLEAKVERLGELTRVRRELYRVCDHAAVIDALGESCGIYCASDRDSAGTYRILGGRLPWILSDRSVYRGVPLVQLLEADGVVWSTVQQGLQWAPVGVGEIRWRTDVQACRGRVWLRCVDPDSGDVLIRRRVDVVPAGCQLSLRIGTPGQPGYIEFKGLDGARVRSLEPSVASVEPDVSGARVVLSDPAQAVDVIGV
jgi:hypothetical protein